jgi:hypothetical protein
VVAEEDEDDAMAEAAQIQGSGRLGSSLLSSFTLLTENKPAFLGHFLSMTYKVAAGSL